jgi:hypothetical protein
VKNYSIPFVTPVLTPSENKLPRPCGFEASVEAQKSFSNLAMIRLTQIVFIPDAGLPRNTKSKENGADVI